MDRITWKTIILCVLYCLISYAVDSSDGQTDNDCVFNLVRVARRTQLPNYLLPEHPLILTKSHGKLDFVPFKKKTLRIKHGQTVYLACIGSGNRIQGFNNIKRSYAKCKEGEFILAGHENNPIPIEDLKCLLQNKFKTYKSKMLACNHVNDAQSYSIGANINGKYLNLINICRDDRYLRTLFTEHTLIPSAYYFSLPRNMQRPAFQLDETLIASKQHSHCDVEEAYRNGDRNSTDPAAFERVLKRTLGDAAAAKYYNRSEHLYVNRGHLAPNGDFAHPYGRLGTFFYLNAAPQYARINEKNWGTLEDKLRRYAHVYQVDLKIYTGTYGTLTLPNDAGVRSPLFLCRHNVTKMLVWKHEQPQVPVPKFLWKIVIDKKTRKGWAFVTSNNPFERIPLDICSPVNMKTDPGSWFPPVRDQDEASGLVYICQVQELVTNLGYKKILTDAWSILQPLDPAP